MAAMRMTNMNFEPTSPALVAVVAAGLLLMGCPGTPEADPIEPGPRISSFSASTTRVERGTEVTLTWTAENTQRVRLERANGGVVEGAVDANGSVAVPVNEDTLFVLTASNLRGAIERQALAVRVTSSAHELLFYGLPAQITAGETASLAWAATDVSSVSISAEPGGPVSLNAQTSNGSVDVKPSTTTTYTLQADGHSATATIVVAPRITVLAPTPQAAEPGMPLTIRWQTEGATGVVLIGGGRGTLLTQTDAALAANGSFEDPIPPNVDPGAVYSYELIAKGTSNTQAVQRIEVRVNSAP